MEGTLLAFRRQPYPEECLAGPVIPAELSIVDQYGGQHVSQIEVRVDRTAIINSLKLVGRQGRGLYAVRAGSVGNKILRKQPTAFSSMESWRDYDGDPARLRQGPANADPHAGKGRAGKRNWELGLDE